MSQTLVCHGGTAAAHEKESCLACTGYGPFDPYTIRIYQDLQIPVQTGLEDYLHPNKFNLRALIR